VTQLWERGGRGVILSRVLADFDLVAHVGVADMTRARAFYGDVLGLPVVGEDPFAVTVEVHGRRLRLSAVPEPVASPYSVLSWDVDDIEAVVDGLVARGVEFARYEGIEQDERGIWTAPGGARVAWFLDPDRNNLSVAQHPA
jgi:catechol 2,3-dioxygenase-like lactoylglutathione lyase family enzyme